MSVADFVARLAEEFTVDYGRAPTSLELAIYMNDGLAGLAELFAAAPHSDPTEEGT